MLINLHQSFNNLCISVHIYACAQIGDVIFTSKKYFISKYISLKLSFMIKITYARNFLSSTTFMVVTGHWFTKTKAKNSYCSKFLK